MEGPELRPVPHEPDEPDEREEESVADDPQTVLAAVRAEWEKATEERTLDLELPGSRGMFVLRLGPIRGATLSKLRQRLEASRAPEKDTYLNADVLIAATRGIYGRLKPGGALHLLEDEDGPLTRIDDRLGRALGLGDGLRARAVTSALFRNANVPDLALARAAGDYMEWASGAEEDVGEEVLGES